MDLTYPISAVCPTLDGPVLAVLAGTTRPLSGREVARLVRRGSPSGVRKTLQRLVDQGTVLVEQVGRTQLFSFNRAHLAAPAVESLVDLRGELVRRLSDSIRGWRLPARHVSMFGSAARGDGDVRSDVDLFIVRPTRIAVENATWREQLQALANDVDAWTGNHAGIVEVGSDELAKAARSAAGKAIREEGILLGGTPAAQLFKRSRAA
jgi:predicted nucleotidyltransferase